LSYSTQYQTLSVLRAFFTWLAGQPGFKSKIRHSDAEYFRLSEKEARIAKAPRNAAVPTLEQVQRTLSVMLITTEERRNRALLAFTLLTGMRAKAKDLALETHPS